MWLELSQRNQIQFKPLDYPFIGTDFPESGLFSELHRKIYPSLLLHFQKESRKILFSKSTEGSSGCLALYLILYSRKVLNSSQTFYIHGV